MTIEFGNIITINYVQRTDGIVIETNIEQVAEDNDVYDEENDYTPIVITVGHGGLLPGLHEELVGKEVGAKGTVLVSAEMAYGERRLDKIHSIDRKNFDKDIMVGSHVRHSNYGIGVVVNKIGKKFVVDFNDTLAGKDIEYEYEICEHITDPAEQFIRTVNHMLKGLDILNDEWDTSFEDGKGIITVNVPIRYITMWHLMRESLIWTLLGNISSLKKVEFREEFENVFTFDLDSDDDDDGVTSFEAGSDSNEASNLETDLSSNSDPDLDSDSDPDSYSGSDSDTT